MKGDNLLLNQQEFYLIFSKTGTFISRCINFYTKDKYVHISLGFDNSFEKMYSFGRKFPDNPFVGGLVEENLSEGVYKKFENSTCLIYKVSVDKERMDSLKYELGKFLKHKDKYRYNFMGLFCVILKKKISRKNHYFCSEFISYLLIKSNIFTSDNPPELIKPSDLLEIKNKEVIYEGLVSDYLANRHNCIYT